MDHDDAEKTALWRYHLVAEALNPRLTKAERGLLVRELSARVHEDPNGEAVTLSRGTLDRWIRAYQKDKLQGLYPVPRSDTGAVRRNPQLFDEAAALRQERPSRSAAQIADSLFARHGVRISERTLREQLRSRGLTRQALTGDARVFGRYEAERPNERWIGDVLVGPLVPFPPVKGSRKAKLFLLVDDHSRLLVHGVWCSEENLRAGQSVLRAALLRRGIPEQLYFDNGSSYSGAELARTCAVLGIRLIHSKPYSPQGRGKQERLNRVIRERFLLEAEVAGIDSLEQLNDRFLAWSEQYLNCRVHRETGDTPIARFVAGGPVRTVEPALLTEAFRWSALRRVTRTAMVSLLGNVYQVDPALVGLKVELRYDPEDLSSLSVLLEGRPTGVAVPHVLQRHTHPAVPQAARPAPVPTGVDFLGLVLTAHQQKTAGSISYRKLNQEDVNP